MPKRSRDEGEGREGAEKEEEEERVALASIIGGVCVDVFIMFFLIHSCLESTIHNTRRMSSASKAMNMKVI